MASRQKAGDTWPAAPCASCSQMTLLLACLNQSGVVQVQPRLPIRLLSCRERAELPGWPQLALSVSPTNPPTTVPNGGQHAKSCHCLYSATASPAAPLKPFTRRQKYKTVSDENR